VFNVFLFAEFKTILADELIKMQKEGVVVVDIRTPMEWKKTGIIKGAKTIEFFQANGRVDFVAFMRELTKYVKDSNQPFIIYCAHANRTKKVGNLYHL
jgi:rhodanese-related sulfurtransferase